MNEQIRQLAEQAAEVVFSSPSTSCTTKQINLEKFAQLIVQECAEICKDTAENQFNPLFNRESDGATVCQKRIMHKFGIEEHE
jgi:hypothetical protein